jgi:hypothetical protein
MNDGANTLMLHYPWLSYSVVAIVIAAALTAFMLRKNRKVELGPKKGVASDPAQVRRDNPPDA